MKVCEYTLRKSDTTIQLSGFPLIIRVYLHVIYHNDKYIFTNIIVAKNYLFDIEIDKI